MIIAVAWLCLCMSHAVSHVLILRALTKTPRMLRSSQLCKTKATDSRRLRQQPSASALSKIHNILSQQIVYNAKKQIGRGAFGTCYKGHFLHFTICCKLLKNCTNADIMFKREALFLSKCSHSNLPWLFGMNTDKNMLVFSYHEYCSSSVSVHKLLCDRSCSSVVIDQEHWKSFLFDIISAIKYLHDISIIHNDIKSDNIVIDECGPKAVVIDLGKACYLQEGLRYSLSNEEKLRYKHDHPQIAPDLRDGYCIQSTATDIYSFGRVLEGIIKKNLNLQLNIPLLQSLLPLCLSYNSCDRPQTSDLFTTFSNLKSS